MSGVLESACPARSAWRTCRSFQFPVFSAATAIAGWNPRRWRNSKQPPHLCRAAILCICSATCSSFQFSVCGFQYSGSIRRMESAPIHAAGGTGQASSLSAYRRTGALTTGAPVLPSWPVALLLPQPRTLMNIQYRTLNIQVRNICAELCLESRHWRDNRYSVVARRELAANSATLHHNLFRCE